MESLSLGVFDKNFMQVYLYEEFLELGTATNLRKYMNENMKSAGQKIFVDSLLTLSNLPLSKPFGRILSSTVLSHRVKQYFNVSVFDNHAIAEKCYY